jgi:hypothetical protein
MYICELNNTIMAIAIKSIPVLKDNVAKTFTKKVSVNNANKSTIDFSKQASVASKILAKAKL